MPAWNSVVLSFSHFWSLRSFFFFTPPACAPVGQPLQSLKESHNIWTTTYHTEAHKKLNLHSLRWMLCWSRHFAFWSHYIAVLLRWENSSCPHNSMHKISERSSDDLSHLSNCSVRSDVNICIGISCLFQGQDFIPSWISRAILEVKRISLCSPAWSFLTVCAQQRKLLVLAHTQSWAPSPQKSAHSFYSPNTLLKAIFAAALREQRYCSCHFQLHRQNREDILGIFFFFFCLFPLHHKFHKTCLPSSNFCLNIWMYGECVETLLLSCCSNGPS